METEILVHTCMMTISGEDYEVFVYSRADGSHIAKTFFTPQDVIINDGPSVDAVLGKHERVLPLAVNSRQILRELRGDF
ncbi:MAG: hypothetical protein P8Z70_06580 [Desulfuromonadales bacterium]|jgi:hypothetical protein